MSIVVGAGKAPARIGFLTGKVTPIQIGNTDWNTDWRKTALRPSFTAYSALYYFRPFLRHWRATGLKYTEAKWGRCLITLRVYEKEGFYAEVFASHGCIKSICFGWTTFCLGTDQRY